MKRNDIFAGVILMASYRCEYFMAVCWKIRYRFYLVLGCEFCGTCVSVRIGGSAYPGHLLPNRNKGMFFKAGKLISNHSSLQMEVSEKYCF